MHRNLNEDERDVEEAGTTAPEVIAELVVKLICFAAALTAWLFALGMFCASVTFRADFRLTFHGLFCRCGERR